VARTSLVFSISVAVFALALSWSSPVHAQMVASAGKSLRAPSEFAHITEPAERSVALFEEAGKVIQNPRCLNCHPATDQPTQTDGMRPHQPLVLRGAAGFGMPGMPCATCHHDANFEAAHVPGHANWHLAPRSMTWAGRSLSEICAQIKDPARNGGRDLAALVRHMAEDSLVGWAWAPGANRTPAPGSQREFGALLQAWVASGAACPAAR
jgi:hypothetical protein